MKKALVIGLFSTILFSHAFSQKDIRSGYILTSGNDTVKGFIDFRNNTFNARKCIFYEKEDSEPKEYLPGEIKGYRIEESRFYVSKEVKAGDTMKAVFLEYLVNGITSLYYLRDDYGDHYFIEKGPDVYELTNKVSIVGEGNGQYFKESNFYKGMLSVAYSDAKQLQPAIKDARFDRKTMMKLSEDYHDIVCTDRKCIIYEKDKKGVEFSIGPAVRYEWYTARYQEFLGHFSFDGTETFQIGIEANLNLLAINEKINIGFRTLIGHDYSRGLWSKTDAYNKEEWKIDFRKEKLSNEIDLIYKYPRGKFKPVAGIGMHLSFFLNNNTILTNTMYDSNGNIIYEIEKTNAIKQIYDIALNVMIGFSQSIGKHSIFFDIFYNIGGQQYTETGTTHEKLYVSKFGKISSVGITTGFLF